MRTALLFLLSLNFLSACTHVEIPNLELCSTAGTLTAGADCAETLTDKTRSMNLDEFVAFLEPQIEPARGAALCMSSESFSRLKSALEKACAKLGRACTKEVVAQVQQVSTRVDGLLARVRAKAKPPRRPRGWTP